MNYAALADQFELEGMPKSQNRFAVAWRETKAEFDAYLKEAEREGGLLLPSMAARLVGLHRSRIHQLLAEGRFTKFEHLDQVWISRREFAAWVHSERDKGGRPPMKPRFTSR